MDRAEAEELLRKGSRRRSGYPFPVRIPRQPAGEAPPTCGDDFAGQLRTFVGVSGFADGIYRCEPGGSDWEAIASVAAPDFPDATFRISDDADPTKKIAFQASGVTTATTRTFAAPNLSGTLALTTIGFVAIGPWFINDLSGTAADAEPHFGYFNTATALSQGGAGFDYLYMPSGGAVVGAILNSDALRTAGTATLRLDKGGVPQDFAAGACVLNATNTNRIAVWVPATGVSGVAGDAFKPRITTSGWTPVTANLAMWLVVRLDAT